MAQIAAHLVDNVFPKVPVRQWVLSFPKRIRYFLHHNPEITSTVLNILITAIESQLIHSSSKHSSIPEGCRLGAVTFIQRFGKALNPHFHFHSCVIDGVFDKEGKFYPVDTLSIDEIQSVQERIRKRVLRLFRKKGLLDSDVTSDMLEWENGGFSLNANVRIEAEDRDGLERLIRYCARPVFSGERLGMVGDKLCYSLPKPTADGQTIMVLKPHELLHKLAQLIPPPKRHRHHYHGVLAPNSPLRTQMATNANKRIIPENTPAVEKEDLPFLIPETSHSKKEEPPLPSKEDIKIEAQEQPRKLPSKASLFRWAMLMARIFEIFPLSCPKCNHPMRIISFIKDGHSVRKILNHINEPSEPPTIAPARGPPEFDYNQIQDVAYAD